MTRILSYLAALAVVAGALLFSATVPDPTLRHRAYAMVLVLAAVAFVAQLRVLLGPTGSRAALAVRAAGFAVVAADVFGTIDSLRTEPYPDSIGPANTVVWAVILAVNLLAVIALTGRRFRITQATLGAGSVFGLAVFGLWALTCLMQPQLPASNAPTVLALALAGMAATQWSRAQWSRQQTSTGQGTTGQSAVAGLVAATTVALLSGVLIDVGLPYLSRWVRNSDPPIPAVGPHGPYRLVDPVGILLLGMLLAVALLATVLAVGRRRASTVDSTVDAVPAAVTAT